MRANRTAINLEEVARKFKATEFPSCQRCPENRTSLSFDAIHGPEPRGCSVAQVARQNVVVRNFHAASYLALLLSFVLCELTNHTQTELVDVNGSSHSGHRGIGSRGKGPDLAIFAPKDLGVREQGLCEGHDATLRDCPTV